MSARMERSHRGRPRYRVNGALAGLLAVALAAQAAQATERLNVFIDQATIVRLPDKVKTIIVGNPLIADATLQSGGLMVLTGTGYGATNVLALDRAGNVLLEKLVQVQGPRDKIVVVHRGVLRSTYSCAPICERRITLGDDPPYFDGTLAQTVNRTTAAVTAGQPPPAPK